MNHRALGARLSPLKVSAAGLCAHSITTAYGPPKMPRVGLEMSFAAALRTGNRSLKSCPAWKSAGRATTYHYKQMPDLPRESSTTIPRESSSTRPRESSSSRPTRQGCTCVDFLSPHAKASSNSSNCLPRSEIRYTSTRYPSREISTSPTGHYHVRF